MLENEKLDRLKKLEKKLKPAHLRGKNFCVKCGFCCYRRTCIPTPEEVKKIAKYLKIPLKKTIKKYFAIDRDLNYFLKPIGINIKDLAGKFIPWDKTYNEGKCIFLDKNNCCKIYPVRPRSAREFKCWKENESEYDAKEYWKEDTLKKEFGITVKEEF